MKTKLNLIEKIFGNPEEIEKARKHDEEERQFYHAFDHVVFIPGSIERCENILGYPCEEIPLNGKNKFITGYTRDRLLVDYSLEFRKRMLSEGIVALVEYTIFPTHIPGYEYVGVPVKKRLSEKKD